MIAGSDFSLGRHGSFGFVDYYEDALTPSERFKLTEKSALRDVHPDGYLVDHTVSSNKKGIVLGKTQIIKPRSSLKRNLPPS